MTVLDTLLYVAIFAVTALGLFGAISLMARAADGDLDRRLRDAHALFRAARADEFARNADARSVTVGRIVDSYTNILTVKLFARAEAERSAVRDALDRPDAFLDLFRLITGVDAILSVMNTSCCATRRSRACLDARRDDERRSGDGLALVMRILAMSGWVMQTVRGIFENVGVVQESMETIARPHALVDAPGAQALA